MTDKHQELEFVREAKRGNITAFVELVDKYKDASLTLAQSILRNEAEAEDVLQDSFIKAFRSIKKFRGKASFSTWLYRIVVNTALDAAARNKKRIGDAADFERENHFQSITPGSKSIFEKDRKKYILEAMNRLKPDEALVLRLFYLLELNIKEVKEITGYSVSKIKVTLHRGRSNLHGELKSLLGEEMMELL